MIEKLNKYFKRPLGLILIVVYKGIIGMAEIILGGVAVVISSFVHDVAGSETVRVWVARELAEDPQGILINWVVAHDPSGILRASVSFSWVLILLGVIDLATAFGVWFRSWLIRDLGVIFFSGAVIYGVYFLAVDFSFLKLLAVLFNTFILFYFWQTLPKYLGPRKNKSGTSN